jgi:hypothetical protein
LIPTLRTLRGPEWAALVDRVAKLPETELDSLAFSLLMIRLDGCVKCHEGSFKYMRGCHVCATQTIMQYKGTDSDLLLSYQKARQDLLSHRTGDTIADDDTTEAAEE